MTGAATAANLSERSIWRTPYRHYTDRDLLRHYRRRQGIQFFAVADPEETGRRKIDDIVAHRFSFNGERYRLPEPIAWGVNPSDDLEWQVMRHKFYYAVGLGMAFRESGESHYLKRWIALTESWIDQAPADFCADPGLRPEATQVAGRRIQNWIYAYWYFVAEAGDECGEQTIPARFHRRFLRSLHDQVSYVCANLSPARNHRTLELYAIFLAAVVFPEFESAKPWLDLARDEIAANMSEDLRADGVHCEQSTDYHHLVLKNYLCVRRLARLNAVELPAAVDARLLRALEFSMHAHKPDGIVPALSDGDARDFRDLLKLGYELYGREELLYVASQGTRGRPPTVRSRGFPDGGYYVLRSGWGEREPYVDERYLIFDCGPLGQGNHGHFDCLHFELAAYGRSLIVDPGRYTYNERGEVNWRARFRGTASHNTVLIDGENQTRYGPKPGKARYKVQGGEPDYALQAFVTEPGFDFVHGVVRSHQYEAVHERRIVFLVPDYWVVVDTLHAERSHDYELLFHLSEHAEGEVQTETRDGTLTLRSPQLVVAQQADSVTSVCVEPGHVSYRYGQSHAAPVLRFHRRAANATFCTVLCPYRQQAPLVKLQRLAAPTEAERANTTLRVQLDGENGKRTDTLWFDTQRASMAGTGSRYVVLCDDGEGNVSRFASTAPVGVTDNRSRIVETA